MNIKLLAPVLFALAFQAPGAHADTAAPRISAQELQADIAFLRETVARSHPDLAFSTNFEAISRTLDSIGQGLAPSMARDEAWGRLALLNPVFADAHLFVGYPEWRADSAAHLASGRTLFPYEVHLGPDGKLSIKSKLGGAADELAGARIVSINGVDSDAATAAMLERAHGDTPAFRTHLLAQRWWLFHWKLYGAAARYRLTLARGAHQWPVEVPGSTSTPVVLRDEADIDRLFRREIVPGCAAVLTVGSFDGEHQSRFLAFTHDSFKRIRKAGITRLAIDISGNGGGDDAMWLEGLMPYLATQPYRSGSAYIKRVLEPNAARGESVGQVISGAVDTWRAPQAGHPLRFTGQVQVVIGRSTYSSAVLFANVINDFGFGTLTGEGGAARRSQSGGVRKYILPHSKLAVWVPRFILHPPAGAKNNALLEAEAVPAFTPCALK